MCVDTRPHRVSRYSLIQFSFSVVFMVYSQSINTNRIFHAAPSQWRLWWAGISEIFFSCPVWENQVMRS